MKLLVFIFLLLTCVCNAQTDTVAYQKYLFHIGSGLDVNNVAMNRSKPRYQNFSSSFKFDYHLGASIQRQLSKSTYLGLGLQYCRVSNKISRDSLFVETNIQEPSKGVFNGCSHYIALPIVYSVRNITPWGLFMEASVGTMYGFRRNSSFEIKAESGNVVDSGGPYNRKLREWLAYSKVQMGCEFILRPGTYATTSVFFSALSPRQLPAPLSLSYTMGISFGVNIQRVE